jgi:stearoyl-CoA desaturase (delta-9 desaturase)
VPDLACYRELRFLDRYHHIVPVGFAVATTALGALLGRSFPALHTGALQFLVWVFVVPTIALYHCTFAVNSVAHLWGTRRFATRDASRNNALVALATLGEGWHNNHHRFPSSARQGLAPLEFDPTWLVIRLFERLGVARDVRRAPSWREEAMATAAVAKASATA